MASATCRTSVRWLRASTCFSTRATISTSHSSRSQGADACAATRPRYRALMPAACSARVRVALSYTPTGAASSPATKRGTTVVSRYCDALAASTSLDAASGGAPMENAAPEADERKASDDSGRSRRATSSGRRVAVRVDNASAASGRSAGSRRPAFSTYVRPSAHSCACSSTDSGMTRVRGVGTPPAPATTASTACGFKCSRRPTRRSAAAAAVERCTNGPPSSDVPYTSVRASSVGGAAMAYTRKPP